MAGNTIWYNGASTIKAKAKYVVDQRLGGVMIWSLNQDELGNRSLLRAIDETLASLAAAASSSEKAAVLSRDRVSASSWLFGSAASSPARRCPRRSKTAAWS